MLNKIEDKEKEVRFIQNELSKLYAAKWKLGSYKLDKPLRHGWYKHLRLRDDIARRKDFETFQNVIDVAGLTIWGRDKKHAEKVWTAEHGRNKEIQFPGIMKLCQKKYDSLLPKAKHHFEGFEQYWTYWYGSVKKYYCRVPRYFFVLTHTKAFITHRDIIDPDLDKQISELEFLLHRNGYYKYSKYAWTEKDRWKGDIIHKRIRRRVKMNLGRNEESRRADQWLYADMVKRL